MRILFLTAELEPVLSFTRVGEVSAGLARGLKNLGHDIRIIAPRFTSISPRKHGLRDINRLSRFPIDFAERSFTVKVRSYSLLPSRAPVYYLDEPFHFGSHPYDPDPRTNVDFPERFGFFSYAALQIVRQLDWRPEVVHCCGSAMLMTPLLMRREETLSPFYSSTRIVLHLPEGEIHRNWGSLDPSLWGWNVKREGRDKLWDISQEAMRLADVVVANGSSGSFSTPWRSQYGWLEGIDLSPRDFLISPSEKKLLEPEDIAAFKRSNRIRLAGLVGDPDLAHQPIGVLWLKGCELSPTSLNTQWGRHFENLGLNWIAVADRHQGSPQEIRIALNYLPLRQVVYCDEEEKLEVTLSAAEVLWVPSLASSHPPHPYRAVRYGAIPIVGVTSPLASPLPPYDPRTGEGLAFSYPADQSELLAEVCNVAQRVLGEPQTRYTLQARAVKADCSWNHAARLWTSIYHSLTASSGFKQGV